MSAASPPDGTQPIAVGPPIPPAFTPLPAPPGTPLPAPPGTPLLAAPLQSDRRLDTWLTYLHWDCLNPQRHWLSLNQAQPPLGDRIARLNGYGQGWKLDPTFPLPAPTAPLAPPIDRWWHQLRRPQSRYKLPQIQRELYHLWQGWQRLLTQGSPFGGLALGLVGGLLLWFLGALLTLMGFWQFAWLFGELSLLSATLPLGVCGGILLRNNRFFPDFPRRILTTASDFQWLLVDVERLPYESIAVRWRGKVVGRSGLANSLGQDLWLETPLGLIKLHHTTPFGPLGLLHPRHQPQHWVGTTVVVQGWLRRGNTVWIDVDLVRTEAGRMVQGYHPQWLLGVAIVAFVYSLSAFLA